MRQIVLLVLALAGMLFASGANTAHAQSDVPPPPAGVIELQRLLAEPDVQEWLRQAVPEATSTTATTTSGSESFVAEEEAFVEEALQRWSEHRTTIANALPQLPGAVTAALGRLSAEAADRGTFLVLLLVAIFVGAGLVAEWVFSRVTRPMRRSVLTAGEETIKARLQKLALRLALVLGTVLAFAAASLGAFLLLELPPLLRQVAGRFLFAIILFRLIFYVCRLVLAPTAPRLRVMPIDDEWAAFWFRRLTLLAGVYVFGWATATSLRILGAGYPYSAVIAYLFGLALFAITVTTIWQRRAHLARSGLGTRTFAAIAWTVIATVVLLLWFGGAQRLMWLALVASLLPMAIYVTNQSVNNLLRPVAKRTIAEPVAGAVVGTEAEAAPEEPGPEPAPTAGPPSVLAAAIERGARALLIAGAAWLLLWAWDLDVAELTRGEGDMAPFARALLNIALIVIGFDFIWHLAKTAIDRYIREAATTEPADADEARRRARLRTLLPIARTALLSVLAVTGVLMILSALGVQIAPLIAGAGVVGIAVGFGSQTLVTDIMSGVFYLLDDAFRVGEYIVAGSYKGTVESFSLRSIKLRHHRGPLYTIPFNALGAVQNMSRDWVIDKLTFTVPFGSDVAKIKKVVKEVSKELLADPELGPSFIEPLKSQGADAIVDHGIVIRVKFTAIPGQQFPIRRRANALIQKAFADNGIEFAFPIVRVAGADHDENAGAASAVVRAQAANAAG